MVKSIFILIMLSSLSGCMEASVVNTPSTEGDKTAPLPVENLTRKEPDFISGELVTTSNGYQIKGAFGEISEKQVLSNGYTVEGAFYQ